MAKPKGRLPDPSQLAADYCAANELLIVDPVYRGDWFAGRMLGAAVKVYDAIGIDRITLRAGLSGGGAHWPKVGFLPVDRIERAQAYRTVIGNCTPCPKSGRDKKRFKTAGSEPV